MIGLLKLLIWVLLFAVLFWIADQVLDILWRDHDNREEEDRE